MGRKKHDNNHSGQIGISWLRWIIEGQWGCGVEVVSAHNDNSLDILIFLKRRKNSAYAGPTGDVIFAQVKTGYISENPVKPSYKLNLSKDYISSHKSRWLAFPGPVIMINVIPPRITQGSPIAYWTNLRDKESYPSDSTISFKTVNIFEGWSGKASLFNLCWRWASIRTLPVIKAPNEILWTQNFPILNTVGTQSFHERCSSIYRDWMKDFRANPTKYSGIQITNRAWRHMTRIGRSKSRMTQSLLLLPAATVMLDSKSKLVAQRLTGTKISRLRNGRLQERYYEGITARMTFYERHEAIVRVVVERTIIYDGSNEKKLLNDTKTLYSIYEVTRKRESV